MLDTEYYYETVVVNNGDSEIAWINACGLTRNNVYILYTCLANIFNLQVDLITVLGF